MTDCCGAPASKEKKWGVKDCRARKCPDLKKNELYPDESQERCYALGDDHNSMMPGTLSCCIKDLDNMPPEHFLRHVIWSLQESWEKKFSGNRKTPGPKNCPPTCPYKASEEGQVRDRSNKADFYAMKKGLIWRCIFTGEVLGSGMSASCPCHILDNPDQEKQIENLKFSFSGRTHIPFNRRECHTVGCPDGICRCKQGDIICPVIKVPFIEIKECPLWRIPAKTLPAIADPVIPVKSDPEVSEKPESSQGKVTQKEKKKEKVRSIVDRIDDLQQQTEMYLWADITHCCVLIQEIKCLLRSMGKPTKAKKMGPTSKDNQSDLFTFDIQTEEARPVEQPIYAADIPETCIKCDDLMQCSSHDPHAGCGEAPKPKEEKKPVSDRSCDTCKGGCFDGTVTVTMDCPDYPDVSAGKIDGLKLREDTRRYGCSNWTAPGTPSKIPNVWGYCFARGCKSVSTVDGICITTGQKIKDMTYCPTQHLADKQPEAEKPAKKPRSRKPKTATTDTTCQMAERMHCGPDDRKACEKSGKVGLLGVICPVPVTEKNCDNCAGHSPGGIIQRNCPSFKDVMEGNISVKDLEDSTRKIGCATWIQKNPDPSLGTCPDKCPYKNTKKSECDFTGQGFIRMECCPCGVMQGSTEGQKRQIENMSRSLARLSADLPSEERCGGNPCPDGVFHCGIGDKDCPFCKEPFEQMALCPMTNARRVRQILREKKAEEPKKKEESDP